MLVLTVGLWPRWHRLRIATLWGAASSEALLAYLVDVTPDENSSECVTSPRFFHLDNREASRIFLQAATRCDSRAL
jgi:hypothetical protein